MKTWTSLCIRRASGRRVAVITVLSAMLGLAACTSSNTPASSNSSGSTTTQAGPIQQGGTLTIAVGDDIQGGGNLQASGAVDDYILNSTVLDPLFDVGKDGQPVPALATKAVPSNNNLTWTLTLRQGVKFTDGKPFNADSVKANLDAMLNPKYAAAVAINLTNLKSYTVTAPYTIVLNLKAPDAHLPYTFMDQLYMQEMNPYNPNDPIGTGPYEYVGRVVGNSVTFKRNPNYWRGKPPLDQVVFKIISNPEVATLDLEKGVVNMIAPSVLDSTSLNTLKSQSGIGLSTAIGADNNEAFMDFEKDRRGGYKNGQDVREGLAYLMNTTNIVPPLVGNVGSIASQPIPPGELGNDPSIKPWPYDPSKGEALLAAGGIPKGGTITMLALNEGPLCPVATAVQATLDSLGYKATLACDQHAVAVNAILSYNWDLAFWHSGENNLAAGTFQDIWDISKVPTPPNFVFTLRDQHLQSLIDQMTATSNNATYQQVAENAAQVIVTQDVASIELFYNKVYIAYSSNVHGVVANSLGLHYGQLMNAISTVWMSQ